MIVNTLEIEGTWEEIAAQAAQYTGRKMRLTVLPVVMPTVSETKDCRSIEDIMADIHARIPEKELAKFPADVGENLTHFVVGTKDERTLDEKLNAILAKVPDEEWAKLPADMGDNLDHYIYGTPKRS